MDAREQVIKWLNDNGHAKVTSKIIPLDNGHFRPVVEVIMGCLEQVKSVDLDSVGGSLLSNLHVDYFENVECEIDGEMKDMHEYRILVEPDSEQHLIVEKMFGEQ